MPTVSASPLVSDNGQPQQLLQFPPTDSDVLTLNEAASLLRCHPKTLRKLATEGKVPARRLGYHWRFSRVALTRWMQDEAA